MNQQSRTLWVSLGTAVAAMWLIYSYSQEKQAEYTKRMSAVKKVLVASKDILEMSTVDDTMLQVEEIPLEFIQPSVISNTEDAVGLVAAAPIKKGEQLLNTKLLTPGPNTGLSLQVTPNKRAVTIPVDDVRGVGKLVRPGDRVDIITSVDIGKGINQSREVKTMLQDVVVLATGYNVTNNIPRKLELENGGKASFRNLNGDTSFSTVTVEVTPKDAQNLIYILSTSPGSLFLTLRNGNDRALQALSNSTAETIVGRSAEPQIPRAVSALPPPPPPAPARSVPKKKGPFMEIK